MLATTLIVILLFSRTKSWACGSSVHTNFDLGKPLKNFCYSHCLLSKSCYQYFRNISRIFPNLKQNVIQTCCSSKSAIF